MACSKLSSYDTGYEDERFEHVVSQSFHCIICTNVFKDPVMCRPHDGHLFCRACITRHLMNSQTCPTCMEPLTVETLSDAPRSTINLLGELRIRCEFFHRGCTKLIELGELERHVKKCGFAPAVCSNEECNLEMNKQDLVHHEIAVCEKRKASCHSCMNDIRQEMNVLDMKLDTNQKQLQKNEANLKDVEGNLVVKVELVEGQLKQEMNNLHADAQGDIGDIKKSLNEITMKLERMKQTLHEVQAQQKEMTTGVAEADDLDTEPKVVVAGGCEHDGSLNSVEMFDLLTGTWTKLQPMKECRIQASSVVYNNQIIVTGGYGKNSYAMKSVVRLSTNVVHAGQSMPWEKLAVELPGLLYGHRSVVYNGRLIVIGGWYEDRHETPCSISEVCLDPPYTSKLLAVMQMKRYHHGVAIFGDKIVIVGGEKSILCPSLDVKSVVLYDITKNECEELAPLPYHVGQMATVKWGDDNIIIIGGLDSDWKPMNKVLIYNIKTQKCHMLPDMKYKRAGCVAAVVKDTVIVMGGQDERNNYLKSVECFRFDRYSWEELPEMHEARWGATAVVC